ncbi:hypothetical protein SH501x_000853 [Pirellulaceae bacterium SH501]
MRTITVYMSDGDTITTGINGTDEEIRRYYLGNRFTLPCETRYRFALMVHFHDSGAKVGLLIKNIESGYYYRIGDVRKETVQVDDQNRFDEIILTSYKGSEHALSDVWVYDIQSNWIKEIGYKHPVA